MQGALAAISFDTLTDHLNCHSYSVAQRETGFGIRRQTERNRTRPSTLAERRRKILAPGPAGTSRPAPKAKAWSQEKAGLESGIARSYLFTSHSNEDRVSGRWVYES
jgi:hypothetical protein